MKIMYPWQNELWQRLHKSRNQLPHAMLLRGRMGTGKFDFALQLSQSLLCQTPNIDGYACDACPSCHWFEQKNHPDYRLLTPEQEAQTADDEVPLVTSKAKKKQIISVEQIRDLGSFLELSSHHSGGLRVALIHPAETLNLASANALLKMLEEPPAGVIFILVSHQPQRLLATILSRCQKIDMPVPETSMALQWLNERGVKNAAQYLAYAGNSPLTALSDATESVRQNDIWLMLARGARLDTFTAAALCLTQGMESAINILQKWIYDLVNCRLTGEIRYHLEHANALQGLSKSVDLGLLLDFQRKLDEARKAANHPLNNELQLESLLLQYTLTFNAT